jgi:2-polyprenyl-3-methyl-5-hydroxy-6-metoxy-1,4-benzoquinol methylase
MEFDRIADIKRLNFIIRVLKENLAPGSTVLDVGCGNGVISRSLGAEGFNVYGIDISEKTIERARALNQLSNVHFDVLGAEQLIANGKKYDAVICSEVLEHLRDPASLLEVIYLSLREQGKLIVTVPNGNGPRERLVTRPTIALKEKNGWLWKSLLKLKSLMGYKGTTAQTDAADLTHIQFFTRKTLEKLAVESHFRITQFGKTNFVEDVFPFSLLTRRVKFLQAWDCRVAETLPLVWTGGFVSVWEKQPV